MMVNKIKNSSNQNIIKIVVNKLDEAIILSGEEIKFFTKNYTVSKSIKDLIKIEEYNAYGGLLYYLFGCRIAEEPKFYNVSYKEISLKFFFKNGEICTIQFSIGDDLMIKKTKSKIVKIYELCKNTNNYITKENRSETKFF